MAEDERDARELRAIHLRGDRAQLALGEEEDDDEEEEEGVNR